MSTFEPAGKHESPGRGILWMLAAGICFVGMDTLSKHLSQDLPVPHTKER